MQELVPGKDGEVRRAKVRVASKGKTSVWARPVQKPFQLRSKMRMKEGSKCWMIIVLSLRVMRLLLLQADPSVRLPWMQGGKPVGCLTLNRVKEGGVLGIPALVTFARHKSHDA